ncbi:glycerol-3-phosphate dehydrogenase/oxidase [Paenibacillus albiflavus]|uniref:Glycerol-3-phosphate dehydrogenase n=1 Tax=Paenibacillus albiflavus TaxID=2545760 RepID=A0A4R4E3R0_9BACL|nr:glycerol-3-phosphate dehydrogenase/oxidase [Paenibacillus albiflavus]TCZ73567.1 glycerol-3-phosphate dehydrogenase/oxidase [Paenibacillus albiflavus]
MTHTFSSLNRQSIIQDLQNTTYDMLVIGGGITGAGIALDGAVRGLKVALIEMQDFAAGTSSRSTKLIHGGLRYLKQGDVALVREVGRERAILFENAKHLVKPEWMLMPIIRGGTYGKFSSSIGILIYDWLAGVKKEERRQMLNKAETLSKEPLLRQNGLIGGGYYVEYRTDDARLTIETMKTAVAKGVTAINYVHAESLEYTEGKLTSIRAKDLNTGEPFQITATKIINATGPWVDTLRELDHSKQGKSLHLTKGVHIVVDQSRFPLRQAIYFDTNDKRMVFAIPRDGKTYIGTTDTNYTGDIKNPELTKEDSEYLIQCANDMFPSLKLTVKDIESSWVGLRPLIHEDGKSPSELSRKDEIFVSKSGLITIAGGKLTGYRKMAERIVDLVCKQLSNETGNQYPACTTDKIKLSGGEFKVNYKSYKEAWTNRGIELGLSRPQADALVQRYGNNVEEVFRLIPTMQEAAQQYRTDASVLASLQYGIESEMVVRPLDFLNRRSSAMNFDRPGARLWMEPVIRYLADQFNWDEATRAEYTQETKEAYL